MLTKKNVGSSKRFIWLEAGLLVGGACLISAVMLSLPNHSAHAMGKGHEEVPAPAPNGIPYPTGHKDWKVIAVSHRTDHKSLRVIVGNAIAVEAARKGETNPWPDGSVLGKLVWKDRQDGHWPAATVPGDFVHAEFMFKDSQKYADSHGWGWARWLGEKKEPYGKDARFASECIACHTPVKDRDMVFTTPAVIP